MAAHIRPLGRLADGGAFNERPENLLVFLQALNQHAAPGILFLVERDEFHSSAMEAGRMLTSCLLEYSSSFLDRTDTAAILDSLLGDEMPPGWLTHDEDAVVEARYVQDEQESWRPPPGYDSSLSQYDASQSQCSLPSLWSTS